VIPVHRIPLFLWYEYAARNQPILQNCVCPYFHDIFIFFRHMIANCHLSQYFHWSRNFILKTSHWIYSCDKKSTGHDLWYVIKFCLIKSYVRAIFKNWITENIHGLNQCPLCIENHNRIIPAYEIPIVACIAFRPEGRGASSSGLCDDTGLCTVQIKSRVWPLCMKNHIGYAIGVHNFGPDCTLNFRGSILHLSCSFFLRQGKLSEEHGTSPNLT